MKLVLILTLVIQMTVVRCTILPKPANGIVTITGTIVGSKATYTCDRGFELIGESTRLCNDVGTWSGTEPTCKGNNVEIPQTK